MKLCRVLKIQKRKFVSFLYVAGLEMRQVMIDNALMRQYDIRQYDMIMVETELRTNEKGAPVSQITKVMRQREHSRLNGRQFRASLSGRSLEIRRCRNRILEGFAEYLKGQGFVQCYEPLIDRYRGTSQAEPLALKGRYMEGFLRFTHEFGLKREVCHTLMPVFEMGYVARDVYRQKDRMPEYLLLETVTPYHGIDHVKDTCIAFIAIAERIAGEMGIAHHSFQDLEICEYGDGIGDMTDRNLLILNLPAQSPLVRMEDGVRTETKWIYRGHTIGHGYLDENNYENFLQCCSEQLETLKKKGIQAEISYDFLSLLEAGIPDTVSSGFGLDRFFFLFFGYDSMKEYRNELYRI